MSRFEGKVAVVTGAGSGIGAATALRLAREGADVVLVGRTRDKLDRTAAAIAPRRTLVTVADVSDPAAVDRVVGEAVERFGRIDVLVNNAGVAPMGSFLDGSLDDYRSVMAINVDGVVLCCRAALPHLLASRGAIVNVSSVSGVRGDFGLLAFYDAAKGAVTNLTRALALEFGGGGVRVNAIAPSLIATEMLVEPMKDEAVMAKFYDRLPLRRAGRPEEAAAAIAFLASEEASFVSGAVLPVDGGVSASNGQPNFLS